MLQHIIDDLFLRAGDRVERQSLEIIAEELAAILSEYDMTPRETALAEYSDVNIAYLNMFLAWKKTEGKSDNTLKSYKFIIEKAINSIQKPIAEITENDIFLYMARYKKEHEASNSYINTIRLYLSSFFSWLSDKGYVNKNPVRSIHPVKIEKRLPKPFTDEELETIKQAPSCSRDKAIIEVLYSTGVRAEELSNLNIDDIDMNSRTVRVQHGKGAKERYTFISPSALIYLKKYLSERDDNNPALFVGKKKPHNRLTPDGIESVVTKISKTAEVTHAYPHKFRRTMATNLLKKGMPLEKVSRILGHQDLQTTMIYCTIDMRDVRYDYEKYMAF